MNSKKPSIFVTGGSGFIGQRLLAMLKKEGYTVHALARSRRSQYIVHRLGAIPIPGDLSDLDALRRGMTGCGAVIHAAARVQLWGKKEDFVRDTITGTELVLLAAKQESIPRFIHISTEAVLSTGRKIHDADETWPVPKHSSGLYSWSKAEAEQRVVAANHPELRTTILRPPFVWGHGDNALLPAVVSAINHGYWFWFNGGHHRISTCHVANVCEGIRCALEQGKGGDTYFLTDGPPVIFRDFLTELVQTQGTEPTKHTLPLFMAEAIASMSEFACRFLPASFSPPLTRTMVNLFFREATVCDAKARQELGYSPIISLDEGLAELRHHYQEKAFKGKYQIASS